jgi:hypothetical protein
VRPSYLAYLHAHVACLEQGFPPSCANLGRELGVAKQTVWKFQRRHPDVLSYVDAQIASANTYMVASVIRKMAMTAMTGGGSPQHAEVYLKAMNGAYRQPDAGGGAPGTLGGPAFIINNLIPRPEPLPVTETVPALPPAAAIPVLEVRR